MNTLLFKRKQTNIRTNKQTKHGYKPKRSGWHGKKTKQNKTRPLIGCTYRYDFNTLKPHARQRERGSSCCKSCSSRRTDCSFFLHSQTDKTDVTKLCILTAPVKKRRWAVQDLADSRYRRRRIHDKEKTGLHAEWSEACVSKWEKRKWCEALCVKPTGLTFWKQQFQFWRLQ